MKNQNEMPDLTGLLDDVEEALIKANKHMHGFSEIEQALSKLKALREAYEELPKFKPCASELAIHKGDAEFFVGFNILNNEYQLRSVDPKYFQAYKKRARMLHQITQPKDKDNDK